MSRQKAETSSLGITKRQSSSGTPGINKEGISTLPPAGENKNEENIKVLNCLEQQNRCEQAELPLKVREGADYDINRHSRRWIGLIWIGFKWSIDSLVKTLFRVWGSGLPNPTSRQVASANLGPHIWSSILKVRNSSQVERLESKHRHRLYQLFSFIKLTNQAEAETPKNEPFAALSNL